MGYLVYALINAEAF
ncbi:potassium-transporting ATPase subunit F [Klebsiella pneumoniae]